MSNNGNGFATRTRARTRDELLDMALEVYDAAGSAVRTYSNAKGEQISYEQPDFKAQLGALRLIAELQGLLKVQPDDGAGFAENVWPRRAERGKEKRS